MQQILLRKDDFQIVVPPWLLLISAMTGLPVGFYSFLTFFPKLGGDDLFIACTTHNTKNRHFVNEKTPHFRRNAGSERTKIKVPTGLSDQSQSTNSQERQTDRCCTSRCPADRRPSSTYRRASTSTEGRDHRSGPEGSFRQRR